MIGVGAGMVQALGAAGRLASGLMAADARKMEFAEQLRQIRLKKAQTVATAENLIGASGFTSDSRSTVDYLKALTSEFDHTIRLTKKAAAASSMAAQIGMFSGLLGSAASIYGDTGRANNWTWGDE